MKNRNYKSYDGNFYRVIFRDLPEQKALDYLKPAYGPGIPLPIRLVDCTMESEQWKFFEIKKVNNEKEASPIVKVGEAGTRCPYCGDRRCITSNFTKGISFDPHLSDTDAFGYSRFMGCCLNPKFDKSYFIVEHRETKRHSMIMLINKQCPHCKGHNSIELFDRTDHNTDMMKDMLRKLEPLSKSSLLKTRVLEYRCKLCNAHSLFTLNAGTKERYFEKLQEVYFK